ncbi:hypothetical protein M9458_004258, partial [Cirrhinus mrigala]
NVQLSEQPQPIATATQRTERERPSESSRHSNNKRRSNSRERARDRDYLKHKSDRGHHWDHHHMITDEANTRAGHILDTATADTEDKTYGTAERNRGNYKGIGQQD